MMCNNNESRKNGLRTVVRYYWYCYIFFCYKEFVCFSFLLFVSYWQYTVCILCDLQVWSSIIMQKIYNGQDYAVAVLVTLGGALFILYPVWKIRLLLLFYIVCSLLLFSKKVDEAYLEICLDFLSRIFMISKIS